jgi:hypothetical protein
VPWCGLQLPGGVAIKGRDARLSSPAQHALCRAYTQTSPIGLPLTDNRQHAQHLATGLWEDNIDVALARGCLARKQHDFAQHQARFKHDALLEYQDKKPEAIVAKVRLCVARGSPARPLPLPDTYQLQCHHAPASGTLHRGAATITCFCGALLATADLEHARVCPTRNVLTNDNVVEEVWRALWIASSKEPFLAALHQAAAASQAASRAVHDLRMGCAPTP